jgi:hypothetical protein
MNEQEMRDLIEAVCEQFRRDTWLSVTEQAVEELFRPAIPHLTNVTRELREASISITFLGQSVRTVLDNARFFAYERKHGCIEFQDIQDSMVKDCPYVFWC